MLIRSSTISKEDRTRCFVHSDPDFFMFESVIKHHCPFDGINIESSPRDTRKGQDNGGISFLDEEDSVMGICWWCMTSVPNDLNALFKLQNWEAMLKVHVSHTWTDEEEVEERKANIREIQRDIKNGEWDGTEGRASWRENNANLG